MRKHLLRMMLLVYFALNAGCLARQFARDGISSQEAVSDIYTEQAMTNLIRARCNMPFVQLKYSSIAVNDEDDVSLAADFTRAFTVLTDFVRNPTDTYHVGGTADRKRIMSFSSDPITDQNDVYERYLDFANNPTLLCVSDQAPCGPVHLHRKCGKKHYWIPCEAGPAFLDLVMKTAIMRGPETLPPAAYEVTITSVDQPIVHPMRPEIQTTIVHFEPSIPNGNATLVFDLPNGRKVRARLNDVHKDENGDEVRGGELTKQLKLVWRPVTDGFSSDNLPGRKARIYSAEYPPEAPVANPVVNRIATDVNTIKVITQQNRR